MGKTASIARPRSVAVVGKHAQLVKKIARDKGFRVVEQKPEMVITFGGDGTILYSERLFPGVPKLCVRLSIHCLKCGVGTFFHHELHKSEHVRLLHSRKALEEALEKIASRRKVKVREETKLVGKVIRKGKVIHEALALNEIQVHNNNPLHAIRGLALVGKKGHYFIGDGVIVSTSFGSTGYFYSVSRKSFQEGIAIAFNNPTGPIEPIFVKNFRGKKVSIIIERRHGLFLADNSHDTVLLDDGDRVEVTQANGVGRFVELQ